ncbi:MAG: hypothetical protein ACOC16_02970 [Nanoarchaeota archaeon]
MEKIKNLLCLNNIQYLLSIMIIGFILMSLIPGIYNQLSIYLLSLVIVNLSISVLRNNVISSFLLFIMFVLLVIGIIGYVGWLFRLAALPVAILNLYLRENSFLYTNIDPIARYKINQNNPFKKNNSKIKKNKYTNNSKYDKNKKSQKIYDAEYTEKKKSNK